MMKPRQYASKTAPQSTTKPSGAANPSKSRESLKNQGLPPGLYVVSTPIGNASDITLRALRVLQNADALIVEDSRVTAKLLAIHKISRPLIVYNDHTSERERARILSRLKSGERLALVSDAGTPLVSDPGFKLVQAAIEEGIAVSAIPGASATLAALVVSGLPPGRFMACGFLPPKSAQRRKALRELSTIPATLIFYESPQRLSETLDDMRAMLGDRDAAIARELTKLHEHVERGVLSTLAEKFSREESKGEIAIVVAPPRPGTADSSSLDERLSARLGEVSLKQAVADIAAELGLPRKIVYARALQLAKPKS